MKHSTIFKVLVTYLILSAIPIYAQYFVAEYAQTHPQSSLIYSNNFDATNYHKIGSNQGENVYVQNLNTNNLRLDQNKLTINLTFDESRVVPAYFMLYSSSGFAGFAAWQGSDVLEINNISDGIYDLVGYYRNNENSFTIIIKELINITQDVSLDIDAAEASNRIIYSFENERGESIEPGVWDQATGNITGGNGEVIFESLIYSTLCQDFINRTGYIWGSKLSEHEKPMWNIYINDVSDRYAFMNSASAVGYDGKQYFAKFKTQYGFDESKEVNHHNYTFHQQKFNPSLHGNNLGTVFNGYSTTSNFNDVSVLTWNVYKDAHPYNNETGIINYFSNPIDGDVFDFIAYPSIVEDFHPDLPIGYFILGNAIVSQEDGTILFGSGNTGSNPLDNLYNQYFLEPTGFRILPFHSKFTYSSTQNHNTVLGSSTPILVGANILYPEIYTSFMGQYKGRFGEIRDSDLLKTQIEVKHNGEPIFEGNYIDYRAEVLPTSGSLEYNLINSNFEIDGLESKNQAQVSYNLDTQSSFPTIQMLQFRNTNDVVTDRFRNASEGILRLAGGDFQFDSNTGLFEYKETATIEVYYSPYNQNQWERLELTHIPEEFVALGFGDYYEASLAAIQDNNENVWYDLKVISKNEADNGIEQVISPAFKINDTMGIENIEENLQLLVYPNPFSNELNILLPENLKGNYTLNVSDLSGRKLYSKQGNASFSKKLTLNGSSLPSGIYILSIENHGKTIVKKVIKK